MWIILIKIEILYKSSSRDQRNRLKKRKIFTPVIQFPSFHKVLLPKRKKENQRGIYATQQILQELKRSFDNLPTD